MSVEAGTNPASSTVRRPVLEAQRVSNVQKKVPTKKSEPLVRWRPPGRAADIDPWKAWKAQRPPPRTKPHPPASGFTAVPVRVVGRAHLMKTQQRAQQSENRTIQNSGSGSTKLAASVAGTKIGGSRGRRPSINIVTPGSGPQDDMESPHMMPAIGSRRSFLTPELYAEQPHPGRSRSLPPIEGHRVVRSLGGHYHTLENAQRAGMHIPDASHEARDSSPTSDISSLANALGSPHLRVPSPQTAGLSTQSNYQLLLEEDRISIIGIKGAIDPIIRNIERCQLSKFQGEKYYELRIHSHWPRPVPETQLPRISECTTSDPYGVAPLSLPVHQQPSQTQQLPQLQVYMEGRNIVIQFYERCKGFLLDEMKTAISPSIVDHQINTNKPIYKITIHYPFNLKAYSKVKASKRTFQATRKHSKVEKLKPLLNAADLNKDILLRTPEPRKW